MRNKRITLSKNLICINKDYFTDLEICLSKESLTYITLGKSLDSIVKITEIETIIRGKEIKKVDKKEFPRLPFPESYNSDSKITYLQLILDDSYLGLVCVCYSKHKVFYIKECYSGILFVPDLSIYYQDDENHLLIVLDNNIIGSVSQPFVPKALTKNLKKLL